MSSSAFRLSKTPRGVGGPQPSDCKSETSDMHCGPKPTCGRLWASALWERYRAVLTPRFTAFTLPVVSEPLRSKGFLSPFAALGAVGSQANGAKVV